MIGSLRRHTTIADRLVILLLLGLAALGVGWTMSTAPGRRVLVTDGNRLLYTSPLDRYGLVTLTGPLGETRMQINAEGVQIVAAPCPLKVCMGMGPARRSGDLVVCVPNRIVVRIAGDGQPEEGYDLLSR